MKAIIAIFLALSLVSSVSARESIQEIATNTDKLYRTGAGAQDGAFTALSMSMLGWGVGLTVGIALLAAALNHSSSSGSSAHCK